MEQMPEKEFDAVTKPVTVQISRETAQIIRPFNTTIFRRLKEHIAHVRRCFDWPGVPYHDANEPAENKFNRWAWHELPYLKNLHNDPNFIKLASRIFAQPLKPSYVFLSMYGKDGVCPPHTDRPQCQFTIDLLVSQDGALPWPIYVDDKEYCLQPGEALAYSGTNQRHYRHPMRETSDCTKVDLAFFHFVPTTWCGGLS